MSAATAELWTGLGAAAAMLFTSAGAAVASVPAGRYVTRCSHPYSYLSFAPIVIAGVLAIYGIIVAALLAVKLHEVSAAGGTGGMDAVAGYKNLAAGLCVGLACLASGMGMARFLEVSMVDTEVLVVSGTPEAGERVPLLNGTTSSGVKMIAPPTIRFLMVLTYLEAIGLYGLIVALVLVW